LELFVAYAACLGKACELPRDFKRMDRVRDLRDYFWKELHACFGDLVALNGHPVHRLPNTLNVSFVGQIGAQLLARLDGVAASTDRRATQAASRCRRCWRP